MTIIVISVAGAAANFSGGTLDQRHDDVVGEPPALHAIVIKLVTQSKRHSNGFEYITVEKAKTFLDSIEDSSGVAIQTTPPLRLR